ncbi:MAG: TIGR01458 family HAD-type hydrolase [Alphaproteobacteria bacterium]
MTDSAIKIRPGGVLLDIGGVLAIDDQAVPGAVEALAALRRSGLPLRFLTNTTRRPRRSLVARLHRLGFAVEPEEILMPALACRAVLEAEGLKPHLLVHDDLEEDFAGLPRGRDAVVVGDAGHDFTYDRLNAAFRCLADGAPLFALARNRVFMEADGLSMDMGGFVAALEYAAQVEARLFGKPAAAFFAAGVAGLGVAAAAAVMVGDDADSDIAGARRAGLSAILVRTGKYHAGDERACDPPPDAVADDFPAAVTLILSAMETPAA